MKKKRDSLSSENVDILRDREESSRLIEAFKRQSEVALIEFDAKEKCLLRQITLLQEKIVLSLSAFVGL